MTCEPFVFMVVATAFFGLVGYEIGIVNPVNTLINTLMNTAYTLLTDTV